MSTGVPDDRMPGEPEWKKPDPGDRAAEDITHGGAVAAPRAAARFNPNTITAPEWLVIGGAALYLVTLVLPWLSVSVPAAGRVGLDESASGFGFAILVLALLLMVAATAWVLLPMFGVPRPVLIVAGPLIPLALCVLALLLTLGKLADVLTASSEYDGFGVSVSTGVGAYLGFLAAAAAVTGAAMLYVAARPDSPAAR